MFDRLLIVWLTLVSLLAYYWPTWFGSATDPFLASKAWLNHLFAVTMFAIGWMLPRDEIEQVRRRWPMVLAGTALQYTSMPFLAWSMGLLLGLDEDARLGLILVGCVPDAMASGVLTPGSQGKRELRGEPDDFLDALVADRRARGAAAVHGRGGRFRSIV